MFTFLVLYTLLQDVYIGFVVPIMPERCPHRLQSVYGSTYLLRMQFNRVFVVAIRRITVKYLIPREYNRINEPPYSITF
jgi:hypothetical protein